MAHDFLVIRLLLSALCNKWMASLPTKDYGILYMNQMDIFKLRASQS